MKLFSKKFPNDEDGQVLKMLNKQGVDFTEPQDVDFLLRFQIKRVVKLY
ncbi:ribonuclease E inhibitor RraB [Peribacillus simplex]